MIKVSIIVPIYNVEKYLGKCLDSLVKQSMKDIEIILVNDGSTDGSHKIISDYESKYEIFKSYVKENGGLSEARNYGLRMAKGEYVWFVDSDDYIEGDICGKLYNIAKTNDLEILKFNYFDEKKNRQAYTGKEKYINEIYTGGEYLKRVLKKDVLKAVVWNALYKREYLEENKFEFKKGILHEDERWTPEVILKAKKIMQIEDGYYFYRFNMKSITSKKDKTQNTMDILSTCKELTEIYKKIEDKKLRTLLMDMLVTKSLEAFVMVDCNKKRNQLEIDKKFLLKNSYTIRNKCKVLLYCLNKELYYKLNLLKNRGNI